MGSLEPSHETPALEKPLTDISKSGTAADGVALRPMEARDLDAAHALSLRCLLYTSDAADE